jgi:FixJ family two-component response regulator
MPLSKPVVHVVEDDDSVRRAIVRLLCCNGFDARSYSSAAEFLLAKREDAPTCVVLDVGLPGMNGIELQAALTKSMDSPPIVFLTGRGDIAMGVRAMKNGAVDFLSKPVKRDALVGAIQTALARDADDLLRRHKHEHLRSRYETLTPREREVFARVTEGKLNKEIAAELDTSLRTVKFHRARVMGKMGVTKVADLVRAADALARDEATLGVSHGH